MATIQVLKSNKRGVKICKDGFLYTKRKESADRLYWRCESLTLVGVSTNSVLVLGILNKNLRFFKSSFLLVKQFASILSACNNKLKQH